ncbi:hypothetical protein [Baaleninema sp.]
MEYQNDECVKSLTSCDIRHMEGRDGLAASSPSDRHGEDRVLTAWV